MPGVLAYAFELWWLWAPVVAAVVVSLAFRLRGSHPEWIGPVFGGIWLIAIAVSMT